MSGIEKVRIAVAVMEARKQEAGSQTKEVYWEGMLVGVRLGVGIMLESLLPKDFVDEVVDIPRDVI